MLDLTYSLVAEGTAEEQAVLRIQEQHRRYFFVPFAQLKNAAADGNILAAVCDGKVVGYVWSHVRHGVVKVFYLAVEKSFSRRGIGAALVEELKRRNRSAYCIRLSCRKDYPGWKFWKKMGFTAIRDRVGRAKGGSQLTDFCFEINPQSLFDRGVEHVAALVAIDANVFFDLNDPDRPHYPEACGLLADWMSAEVELCVTVSIHEDLGRRTSADDSADALEGWRIVEASPQSFRCIREQLRAVIGDGDSDQDRTDRNHLSHAIAENLSAFITRDGGLLENANKLYDQFGINVSRPSEFIVDLDTVLNQDRYDRHDVESVGVRLTRVNSLDEIGDIRQFRRGDEKESKLKAQMRTWLANPGTAEVRVVSTTEGVEALSALSSQGSQVEVPLFRCTSNATKRRRGRTMMRYLASTLGSATGAAATIKVSDLFGYAEHAESLAELGFVKAGDSWYKIQLPGIWKPAEAAAEISGLPGLPTELAARVQAQLFELSSPESYLQMERLLSPGKLASGDKIPCFVIPIRPHWARALFDADLGSRQLWDEDADLLFNPSSVYYSGARIKSQSARLLWYVSSSEKYSGTKCVRASSQLRGTTVGKPLQLYRRFRHYGIYGIADVERTATGKRSDVMAIEFSDTETFAAPVKLGVVRQILEDGGQAFQWPTRISESQFFAVYQHGTTNASSVDSA